MFDSEAHPVDRLLAILTAPLAGSAGNFNERTGRDHGLNLSTGRVFTFHPLYFIMTEYNQEES
jgi:hypothetical protein